jgi:hypothetical protein
VWCGPVFILTYIPCWLIAGWLPPPLPSWDAATITAFYAEHRTAIRIGQVGAMTATFWLVPFWMMIASYVREIERGRIPILYRLQLTMATANFVFFTIPSVVWLTATFRPELPASTVQTWNDFAWIGFLAPFAAYSMNLLALGAAILTDRRAEPMWPRWVGYYNIAMVATSCLGGLVVFFKTGPLAWNGLFGFYILCVSFVVWIAIMTTTMHKWIRRQQRSLVAGSGPAPVAEMATAASA